MTDDGGTSEVIEAAQTNTLQLRHTVLCYLTRAVAPESNAPRVFTGIEYHNGSVLAADVGDQGESTFVIGNVIGVTTVVPAVTEDDVGHCLPDQHYIRGRQLRHIG